MQRDDERPASTGRPSLLSGMPPADSGHGGILHGLEGGRPAAAAPTQRRAGGKLALAATGTAIVLAVAVAAVVWMDSGTGPEPVLAAAAPPAPVPVPAEVPVAAPPVAAIVEESAAVSPPADNTRSLKEMLNDTPAQPARDELSAALERPHPAPAKVKVAEHKKAAAPVKKPVQQLARKTEPAAKPKPARQDSDVTLLAALMAHVQAGQPGKAPSTPAYQLKQCKLMNEAGAAQCREHLCSTTARKEPECKQQPVASRSAAES